ncbi:hypothetical protein HCK00_08495 [Streptomyces sp. PLAI1-29]|uniref:Secreted protein n=1 Tax=Streptomyces zingiberis TaxID=2053010 RepID=A0ABX1BU18_9ACTN|nr:hypothetical protein [Streptomyces zingiberis]
MVRVLAVALLTGATLAGTAGSAAADDPSPGAGDEAPGEAGTSFRLATAIQQDQKATADASAGDYLYWVFPADTGQRVTVRAGVELPESARSGASRWRVDVYDGLRRRQPCVYGAQARTAGEDLQGETTLRLSCTLRPVRSYTEPWDDAPLPGSYYVRLTVVDLPARDRGLPVRAEVEAVSVAAGGAHAVDGTLAEPLVPLTVSGPARDGGNGTGDGSDGAGEGSDAGDSGDEQQAGAPEDGWSSGRWSDRWLWTVAGGLLAALAAVGGHRLARRL